MKQKFTLFIVFIFFYLFGYSQPNITLKPFATGLTNPVNIAHAGDNKLYVVERAGRIMIVDSTGVLKSTPLIDITSRVVSAGDEQGLLGLAFHPQFAQNKYFYVNYTGMGDSTHISRFTMDTVDVADTASEVKLMTIYQPFKNHNGGHIAFGPDSFLYIGLGDGGSAGDPQNRAQDSTELLGKILRIDVNSDSLYDIPASNPFMKDSSAIKDTAIRGEIWAMGLRNPWRFSFDRSTNDLWITDVGQDKYEEINYQSDVDTNVVRNYGWRCYEGDSTFNAAGCDSSLTFTFPVFTYDHSSNACSVTGGYVYRGTKYPSLTGHYFFADFCNGNLWTILHDSTAWDTTSLGQFADYSISAFGEDAKGELYVASMTKGIIYQITVPSDTGGIALKNIISDVKIFPNPFTENLTVEVNASGNEQAHVVIYDLQGRIVFEQELKSNSEKLNLPPLNPGMYLLNVKVNGTNTVKKIIKL